MHYLSIGTFGRTTLASSSGALVDWLNGDWGIFFYINSFNGNTSSFLILWIIKK